MIDLDSLRGAPLAWQSPGTINRLVGTKIYGTSLKLSIYCRMYVILVPAGRFPRSLCSLGMTWQHPPCHCEGGLPPVAISNVLLPSTARRRVMPAGGGTFLTRRRKYPKTRLGEGLCGLLPQAKPPPQDPSRPASSFLRFYTFLL